ncbi:MAG: hypothetical protein ACXVIY_04815 [Mucilaginibacter sp.]
MMSKSDFLLYGIISLVIGVFLVIYASRRLRNEAWKDIALCYKFHRFRHCFGFAWGVFDLEGDLPFLKSFIPLNPGSNKNRPAQPISPFLVRNDIVC